jgi:hypothetical protein
MSINHTAIISINYTRIQRYRSFIKCTPRECERFLTRSLIGQAALMLVNNFLSAEMRQQQIYAWTTR